MMSFARLSLLLLIGTHASTEEGADIASRELHEHGGREHHGGERNHTNRNMTEWLNQTCTENGIVCSNVAADVLANCTNFTDYGRWHHDDGSSEDESSESESSDSGSSEDASSGDESSEDYDEDRGLLVRFNEAGSVEGRDEELVDLYNIFEGAEELEEKMDGTPSTELRGSVSDFVGRHLRKKRPNGRGGRNGGSKSKSGKWGNLTDAELDEMKLRRLTCRCCKDFY
ncbi:hypothetical protein HJC23_003897 [Cyclotella cryptica]|uniref:Uncharacterized protein n=1 Tax=Cyclotella cryptica TaxID=29204 RepID=A0ABD3PE95_9STRA|eukprot:CCRYP_015565-RA/>CCRYP_015565-RA protein AED:0.35 eAED:0.35 QI:0/-1/0/1/-1/1/1/0/227